MRSAVPVASQRISDFITTPTKPIQYAEQLFAPNFLFP